MRQLTLIVLLLGIALTGASSLTANDQGAFRVEIYDAITRAGIWQAQGSDNYSYDQYWSCYPYRISNSFVFQDGSTTTTQPGAGVVATSWATDYIPITTYDIQIYLALTTIVRHYLYHPVLSLSISPTSVTEGNSMVGTITLKNASGVNVTIRNALTLNLSSNTTTRATVPATVTIPANTSSVSFTVNALDNAVHDGNASVVIGATAGTWGSTSTMVTVLDND